MHETLNPYRNFLGARDPLEVMAATPDTLRSLAGQLLGPKINLSYAPGKWTARQILCHLADCEIAFAFRLRQAAAEKDHIIQPFDQDAWSAHYADGDPAQALEVFSVVRGWNVAFVNNQPEGILNKSVTHPERGAMTFGTILQTMGGHDLNHLGQLETIAGQN